MKKIITIVALYCMITSGLFTSTQFNDNRDAQYPIIKKELSSEKDLFNRLNPEYLKQMQKSLNDLTSLGQQKFFQSFLEQYKHNIKNTEKKFDDNYLKALISETAAQFIQQKTAITLRVTISDMIQTAYKAAKEAEKKHAKQQQEDQEQTKRQEIAAKYKSLVAGKASATTQKTAKHYVEEFNDYYEFDSKKGSTNKWSEVTKAIPDFDTLSTETKIEILKQLKLSNSEINLAITDMTIQDLHPQQIAQQSRSHKQ